MTHLGALRPWKSAAIAGTAVFVLSTAVALVGVWWAESHLPHGLGWDSEHTGLAGLYRFDSEFYLELATTGYSYDGDPCRKQNVVFMPAYPTLIRLLSAVTGLSPLAAGLWVARLGLLGAGIVLFRLIETEYDRTAAWFTLLGIHFSAGSWAFHAYYSESTMLLFLVVALLARRRGRRAIAALACFALSASRVTVAPFAVLFALDFARDALTTLRSHDDEWPVRARRAAVDLVYAVVCVGGLAGYLGFLWRRFGNPFELISSIKYCAWGNFHQPMTVIDLFTLRDLLDRTREALTREGLFLADPRTTSLIWTVLALLACLVPLLRRRWSLTVLGFAGYFVLTYYATGKAEWLQSNSRYFAPMFTIYLLAYAVYRWLRARWPAAAVDGLFAFLLALNATYMWVYLTRFSAGIWYFF